MKFYKKIKHLHAFEYVGCKMAAILPKHQCVKPECWRKPYIMAMQVSNVIIERAWIGVPSVDTG